MNEFASSVVIPTGAKLRAGTGHCTCWVPKVAGGHSGMTRSPKYPLQETFHD